MNDELLMEGMCAGGDRWRRLLPRLSPPAWDDRWPYAVRPRSRSATPMTTKGASACCPGKQQTVVLPSRDFLLCETSVPRIARIATNSTVTLN